MALYFLNTFTCNARVPARLRTGTVSLLVETDQGPVLVDTGLGTADYRRKPAILRAFQLVTKVPLNVNEAAVRQLGRFGYRPEDVAHIVLTHMHFDHCGGLLDFPRALVHVHRRELEAFRSRPRRWTDLAYVRAHIAHEPTFVTYEEAGQQWFDFAAVRLPFRPPMWLVPLIGDSRGHCGVALDTDEGWHFHVAAAAPLAAAASLPAWLVRLVLGPHAPRLQAFGAAHPEISMTTAHMELDFFEAQAAVPVAAAD
ncbi:MAG: MBL fold metallo-hydrolase [Candidatus Promineifilaceae bacterium]|nr:MBL fold metallo-hydrolase [Candidatus Promineifilaceae bacterium]